MKRIGIFGGAFNPINIGHLKMAEAARKEYKLNVVYFIPCGIPPHKPKKDLLPAKLRYELVKKMIKGKKYFDVLDIEIKKKKPAYTIETIKELVRKKFHNVLYFLIGADEFEKLHTWNKPNTLAKLVVFLVLPRHLTPSASKQKLLKLPKIKELNWHLVHTKPINISSTEIRRKMNMLMLQQKLH